MRIDHGLPAAGAPLRHLRQQMTVTEQGLRLGDGTLLAKMADDGLLLEGEEERILTLLAVAYRRDVPAATLGSFRRAAKHWQSGDKCLAAIHFAQNGLGELDEDGAYRLSLAAELIEAGMTPRELARELGLSLPRSGLEKAGYNPYQPRTRPGYHHENGEWSKGGPSASTLTQGRSAGTGARRHNHEHYKTITDLPKDAVAVKDRDGGFVDDLHSTTGFLMAPPNADFKRVYATGQETAPGDILAIINSVAQGGAFDYQRDPANRVFYDAYRHAANYAVGVFMAGAGFPRAVAIMISQTYAFFESKQTEENKQ